MLPSKLNRDKKQAAENDWSALDMYSLWKKNVITVEVSLAFHYLLWDLIDVEWLQILEVPISKITNWSHLPENSSAKQPNRQ